jgi:hypothetical protein
MNLPTTRLLRLDTCAMLKLFVAERGHDVLMWLLKDSNGEAILCYSAHCMTSVHVRDEFPRAVAKEVARKEITEAEAKGILRRSEGYLRHPAGLDIVDTGPLPGFKGGKDTSVERLMQKYGLKDRDRTDCAILASIVNYLRCFGGGSLPHVVTADGDFAKVIKAEGFGVINPEKMSVGQVKAYLASLS